jgi:hypothetical protein
LAWSITHTKEVGHNGIVELLRKAWGKGIIKEPIMFLIASSFLPITTLASWLLEGGLLKNPQSEFNSTKTSSGLFALTFALTY